MKFVIFDIDGTLTDTKKVEDISFVRAFKRTFGLDISDFNWADFESVTDWYITEQIIERTWKRKPTPAEYDLAVDDFVKALKEEYQRDSGQFKEVKGAKAFFDHLKTLPDLGLGIATGGWKKSARFKLATVDIDIEGIPFSTSSDYQTRVAITQDTIQQMKRKFGVEPEQVIYLGDGVWDYKTCQQLGIPFIGIDAAGDGVLKEMGAEQVYQDYLESEGILEYIRGLS